MTAKGLANERRRKQIAAATKLLMSELLQSHHQQVTRLVGKSLAAIEDAFDAQRVGCSKAGEAVGLGKDHFARLAASKRLVEMMQAAREDTPAGSAPCTITWEAFLALQQTLQPKPPEPPE